MENINAPNPIAVYAPAIFVYFKKMIEAKSATSPIAVNFTKRVPELTFSIIAILLIQTFSALINFLRVTRKVDIVIQLRLE